MRKTLYVICCAGGSFLIGFFANKLDTVYGCVLFALGVALLTGSIVRISKEGKDE